MQSSDDVVFTMMSFSAKNSEKSILLGKEINLKAQNGHKSSIIVLQWYLTSD